MGDGFKKILLRGGSRETIKNAMWRQWKIYKMC